jgi:hypothetical protein
MEVKQYPYSLGFSIAGIVVIVVLMLLLLSNVLMAGSLVAWVIYGLFSGFFLFMIFMLITRRLIPAIKGDIALQLDEEGISDYIRDVSINWEDIKNISLLRGRSSAAVRIELNFESDYGKTVNISLRWIKGKDEEIYDTIAAWLERHAEGK